MDHWECTTPDYELSPCFLACHDRNEAADELWWTEPPEAVRWSVSFLLLIVNAGHLVTETEKELMQLPFNGDLYFPPPKLLLVF